MRKKARGFFNYRHLNYCRSNRISFSLWCCLINLYKVVSEISWNRVRSAVRGGGRGSRALQAYVLFNLEIRKSVPHNRKRRRGTETWFFFFFKLIYQLPPWVCRIELSNNYRLPYNFPLLTEIARVLPCFTSLFNAFVWSRRSMNNHMSALVTITHTSVNANKQTLVDIFDDLKIPGRLLLTFDFVLAFQ